MNPSIRNPDIDLQFSIGSIMCTTGTVAVLLNYLKATAHDDFVMGVQILCIAIVGGFVLGHMCHRPYETALWAALGSMTSYLCAMGEPLPHRAFNFAWSLVGAATAGSAILLDAKPLWKRMVIGASIATAVLSCFSVVIWWIGGLGAWMEVACGPLAGAIMVGVVWLLESVRVSGRYSRGAMILTLTLGVIGGNVFGRWIGWL